MMIGENLHVEQVIQLDKLLLDLLNRLLLLSEYMVGNRVESVGAGRISVTGGNSMGLLRVHLRHPAADRRPFLKGISGSSRFGGGKICHPFLRTAAPQRNPIH